MSLGCKWKTIKFIEITCCCLKCVVAHCVAACADVVVVVVVVFLHTAVALSLCLCSAVFVTVSVPVLAASFPIVNIKSQTVKPLLGTHAYTHTQPHTHSADHTRININVNINRRSVKHLGKCPFWSCGSHCSNASLCLFISLSPSLLPVSLAPALAACMRCKFGSIF